MGKRELELTSGQRAELEQILRRDRRPYLRECAAALLKVSDGHSAHHVALHGLSRSRKPDTIYGWITKYENHGIQGLIHKPRGHRGFSPSASSNAHKHHL